MDVFTLDSDTYRDGDIVNGIDSLLWVERYETNGEFTIIGDPTPELMDKLSLGRLISHSETYDMMMVENHEIDESKEGDVKVKITGRTVEAIIMENRVVKLAWYLGYEDPTTGYNLSYPLIAADVWDQIVTLIHDYVQDSILYINATVPNMDVIAAVLGDDPNPINRIVKIGVLYPSVLELLGLFGGGIRVLRPNPAHSTMRWIVHDGVDKTDTVHFNWLTEDIDKAHYLWSNKPHKHRVYVSAKYYGSTAGPWLAGRVGFDHRESHLDMSDYTNYYPSATVPELDAILEMMAWKGYSQLAQEQPARILDATISPLSQWRYRTHYNIGDIVHVRGNYGVEGPMRVVEYAETLDKDGASGFPTLSNIKPFGGVEGEE